MQSNHVYTMIWKKEQEGWKTHWNSTLPVSWRIYLFIHFRRLNDLVPCITQGIPALIIRKNNYNKEGVSDF